MYKQMSTVAAPGTLLMTVSAINAVAGAVGHRKNVKIGDSWQAPGPSLIGDQISYKITGREPGIRREKPAELLYDREVPLNGSSTTHSMLHDWLDGEVDVMRASEVEGKSKVELWTRINAESEMLRRRVTPVGVQQRIMASLPENPGTVIAA